MADSPTAGDHDTTDLPTVVRGAVTLGLFEAAAVLVFSLASRLLGGPAETVVCGLVAAAGLAAVTVLPGLWTRARTVEGIAGAAGIGLAAAWVFLLIDVALLQNIGTYSNRWSDIGGGSNWWYHPVWWMVGTFLPWMGAWALAIQADRGAGRPSPAAVLGTAFLLAAGLGVVAVVIGFPGAGWSLATFGVAFLPAAALAVALAGMRPRPA